MAKQRIRIRLKAYDHRLLDQSAAQIVETALLTMLNFQTLIATKAARVCIAAAGDAVLEFGARRMHPAASIDASSAASIPGCRCQMRDSGCAAKA